MKVDPQKIWLLWPVVFVLTIIIATVLAIWTVITSMLLEPLGFASSVISMVSLLFVTVSLLLMFRLLHRLSDEQLPELESALGRLQVIEDRTKAAGLIGVEQKQVFHDRIDKHFSSVTLDAYKKLRGLEIDELSRINLFAGVNNSGKTTLLEAVYLLARQNDFDGSDITGFVQAGFRLLIDPDRNAAWLAIEDTADLFHQPFRVDPNLAGPYRDGG